MKKKQISIAIVSSSFRHKVADSLEKNCLNTLKKHGLKLNQVKIYKVPGAFEMPLVVMKLAQQRKYHAIIAFGAIYKGKTYHFEQLANQSARAFMDISLKYETPVIFEVLAVYNPKHALERATRKKENKGVEAALTALKMIKITAKL